MERLPELFAPDQFYCPPREVIIIELRRDQRGHFNIIHHNTGFKADVYAIGRDPLHSWAMQHVQRLILHDQAFSVAPPEYVIVRKLEFYREGGSEKHLRDIRSMVDMSADLIDNGTLARMIQERGLTHVWRKVGTTA